MREILQGNLLLLNGRKSVVEVHLPSTGINFRLQFWERRFTAQTPPYGMRPAGGLVLPVLQIKAPSTEAATPTGKF
jgi:hypothetical protein